jgi:hypothetical protein
VTKVTGIRGAIWDDGGGGDVAVPEPTAGLVFAPDSLLVGASARRRRGK